MQVYWLLAALFLTGGHVLKAMRWHRFVRVYEETSLTDLIRALACGYLLNFYIPFHLGDVARVAMSGRRMKNGCSYATATILIDRLLDILAVAVIFWLFAWGLPSESVLESARSYLLLVLVLVGLIALLSFLHYPVKRLILGCSSVFNDSIRFQLLFFFWSLISSFKDLFRKVKLLPLLLETAAMWCAYLASYGFAAMGLQNMGANTGFRDVFFLLFHSESFWKSTFAAARSALSTEAVVWLCGYILIPLPLLLLGTLLARRKKKQSRTIRLLPQIDAGQQLQFLNAYFSADRREAIQEYLNMNRDVSILQDCSAGSDATTMLCSKGGQMVYRKYAFGAGPAGKLKEQVAWLRAHGESLPLPEILFEHGGAYSFCYDMPCDGTSVGMFSYICSHSPEQSWDILRRILQTLQGEFYAPGEQVSREALEEYVTDKVRGNLEKILSHRALSELCRAEHISINGRSCLGLPKLMGLFREDYLAEVFSQDRCCPVHGDLTVENIICRAHDRSFYLIDPNPANPIKTPGIDYGKLLQSLHGRYELLAISGEVTACRDSISFPVMDAPQYPRLYGLYEDWLKREFSLRELRSIYFHELVHWLRLLPYKLRKDERSALRYFAAMLMVANDIYTKFPEGEHEEETCDF